MVGVPAQLVELYRQMLRIRLVDERIAELYPEQEMRCPVHLSIGQEAAAVGVCAALRADDYVFGTHRSHGHYLAKGGDLRAMLAEFYGKATGCSGGRGGSMHLIDVDAGFLGSTPIVGSTIPIAVGAALAVAMQREPRVVAVFLGDGATEEGVFHESLNFAALRELPVLFVCENNLYSVNSPLSVRQSPRRDVCAIAEANGIPSARLDGNDVGLVFAGAADAIERARSGDGASLLELDTYRWRTHCGPGYDGNLGYRTEAELEAWRARDPIAAARERLLADGAFDAAALQRIEGELEREIDDAVAFAKESPFPDGDELLADVYGT